MDVAMVYSLFKNLLDIFSWCSISILCFAKVFSLIWGSFDPKASKFSSTLRCLSKRALRVCWGIMGNQGAPEQTCRQIQCLYGNYMSSNFEII